MQKQVAKSIALYGGAFDPPHNGHIAVIKNLDSIAFINQIWLLPSGDRSDKKLLLSKDQRFDLLHRLAKKYLGGNEKVKVIDEEIKLSKQKNRMIPTIQLLQHFSTKYPSYEFHFVIGTDILHTINTWQQYQRLLSEHKFIIFPRKGYQIDIKHKPKHANTQIENKSNIRLPIQYFLSNFTPPQISSSFIKNTIWDQKLNKQQKQQKVKEFLDQLTIELLEHKNIF